MAATLRERQARLVDSLRIGSSHPELNQLAVSIRTDYRADRARCLTAVTFVPDSLAREIERKIVAPLRRLRPEHYYYPAASMRAGP